MSDIEDLFGGEDSKAHNAVYDIIKKRGDDFLSKHPPTTTAVRLVQYLKDIGFEIVESEE